MYTEEDLQTDIKNIYTLDTCDKIKGTNIEVSMNKMRTIAKIDYEIMVKLQNKIGAEIVSIRETMYPENLRQYPNFLNFKLHFQLGIPDKVWAEYGKIGFFQYGDVVYMCAPIIDIE